MLAGLSQGFAQRFTTGKPAQASVKRDTGSINAEKSYLALKAGDLDKARRSLASADPSNPFSIYVRAYLTQDANQAAEIYKLILSRFAGKPIAGEALLQLYKYHYAAGDYRLAHTDYLQLNKYQGMSHLVDPDGLSDKLPAQTGEPGNDTLQSQGSPEEKQSAKTPPASLPVRPQESAGLTYSVQLGVFSTQDNANRFAAHLKTENIKAAIAVMEGKTKTLYVVTTGKFASREAAESFAADLKSRSIDCVVVSRGEPKK